MKEKLWKKTGRKIMAKTQIGEPLFHIAKRGNLPLWKAIVIRGGAIVGAILFSAILCAIMFKASPFEIIRSLFNGILGTERRIWLLIRDTALLLGVGLALLPAFKMKFWNLGGNGQILMGALVTVAIMRSSIGENSPAIANILMLIGSIVIGAIWAVIPAIFKAFFKTNESLFTLMMNYIASGIVAYFLSVWSVNGTGVLGQVKTGHLPEIANAHLLTILVVAFLTALMHVYMKHCKQGYEISVVGESENTAKYIGINVKKVIIRTLAISGAICGIIGLLLAGAIDHSINEQTANNMGFTAIMVAWLAKFNPLIMILSSLLIAFLTRGMGQVQTDFGIFNDAIANLVVGIVYFIVIGCEFFISYQIKFKKIKKSTSGSTPNGESVSKKVETGVKEGE